VIIRFVKIVRLIKIRDLIDMSVKNVTVIVQNAEITQVMNVTVVIINYVQNVTDIQK